MQIHSRTVLLTDDFFQIIFRPVSVLRTFPSITDSPAQFRWNLRVYYEDTDAAGIVYYANYLKFFERCRTEWLRALGFEQQQLATREHVVFVVSNLQMDFIRPARLDDTLSVSAHVSQQARASLQFEQQALRITSGAEELMARAQVKVVCVERDTLRPTALPRAFVDALLNAPTISAVP